MDLNELRNRIDKLDSQLLDLLNQRMEVVREVGALKRHQNTVIYRPEREKYIIDRLDAMNSGLLTRPALEAIFQEIFAVSRNFELPERVAYLGPEGSFTHQAAESRFGASSEYIALSTIKAVFDSVETERSRFGVVPIENNQEGSVAETIDLLCDRAVHIVAELPMHIHFTFASKQDHLKNIEVIYSKDIAFRQCRNFLTEYFGEHVRLVEVTSTSKAAKLAMEVENSAAICSHIAAKLYSLPVLFDNIEDSRNNRTRFLILSKHFMNQPSGSDKTSILAKVADKPGALVSFLQEFQSQNINLTKVDSRPARIHDKFKYWFLIDFDGHFQNENVRKVLEKYEDQVTLLGSYVKLC